MFGDQVHTDTYSDMQHHVPGHMQDSQPVNAGYSTRAPNPVPEQPYNPTPAYNPSAVNQGGYNQQSQPLLPPPMPPFTTSGYMDTAPYTDTYAATTDTYSKHYILFFLDSIRLVYF